MTKYAVNLTIEANSIQDAITRVLYPAGEELQNVVQVWAEEEAA